MSNASLILDKRHEPFPPSDDPEYVKKQLTSICDAAGDSQLLKTLHSRFDSLWRHVQARTFEGKTVAPLSLHLSRSATFENAGLALHPLYGFAWIPGSGLKGLARAYARLNASSDDITRILGHEPLDTEDEEDLAAGSVVFHDAYPIEWPKLHIEILNNHHSKYYAGEQPPYDDEDPIPVSYLAVNENTRFRFAISPRTPNSANDLDLAEEWLRGGLRWLGAGAKTNSGHGYFEFGETKVLPPKGRSIWSAELELVSPAFLAGALQKEQDCTLRPATLRGLLRWWWRALHSGYRSIDQLREWEKLLWGAAEQPGAIGIRVVPVVVKKPKLFDPDVITKQRSLSEPPGSDPRKWTNSLTYLAYGMQRIDSKEKPERSKPARYYIEPGARWCVSFSCRAARGEVGSLNEKQVAHQAAAALCALSRLGGVGGKSRHGFGSLNVQNIKDLDWDGSPKALAWVHELKASTLPINSSQTQGSSLAPQRMIHPTTLLSLKGGDAWAALHDLGSKLQSFAQKQKHNRAKSALGLPRRMRELSQLDLADKRLASPVHFRLVKENNTYKCQVTIFKTALPRNVEKLQGEIYKELLKHLGIQNDA